MAKNPVVCSAATPSTNNFCSAPCSLQGAPPPWRGRLAPVALRSLLGGTGRFALSHVFREAGILSP